jgi:hypothetical protein
MSRTAASSPSAAPRVAVESGQRRRRPAGQNALAIASLTLIIASFLPWIDTAFGSFNGMAGAGVYTFYAGVLGIAGSCLPWRRVALVHAVLVAAAALGLPAWQVASLLALDLGGGWVVGTGLLLAVASGSLALRAIWQLALQR